MYQEDFTYAQEADELNGYAGYPEDIEYDDDDEYYGEYDDDDELSAEYDDDDEDYDDEVYGEFDDDDESFDDDDEAIDGEFILGRRIFRKIRNRIKRRGYRRRGRRYKGLKHNFNRKRVRFKRGRFAQKSDLIKLRNANASEHKSMRLAIKRNASTIRKNVSLARKAVSDIKSLDKKHSKVAAAQTSMIKKLDKGLGKVKKDITTAQQAQQQQQLFSMLLKPELESIQLTGPEAGATAKTYTVGKADYKNEMLPLLFAFMGNQNSSGGNGMNNMMLPLLLTMND